MGDFYMRLFAQIVSFFIWIIGTLTSILSKISPVIDDSISAIAGLIGIMGGIVWLGILRIKLKNEKMESEIKKEELKRLKDETI